MREKIEGTPFYVVGNEEKGYMGTFNRYQVTTPFKTPEEVVDHIEKEKFNIILTMVLCVLDRKELLQPIA